MFPAEFDYHRAESVDHAVSLLGDHPDAELLAGGHSLIPTMKSGLADPGAIVDLGDLDSLVGIDRAGDGVHVGAMTTYATVADEDEGLWGDAAVVAHAAHEVGDIQVRNRGTIGGNVAHADPASDLPAAVLAADATIHVRGPDGDREIPADDFFLGMYATAVGPDELVTGIEFPAHVADATGAYAKRPSPSSGYALVGVAASLVLDGDEVADASVAANGVMDHAVRLDGVEDELTGTAVDEAVLADAADRATEGLDVEMMMSDEQASGEFRGHLVDVYTERALETAVERAR
jgi:carbon-monoxide dehydrogenase medium subunit